jgi:hypothetical protein
MQLDFEYELPSGQIVTVEATVEPGRPALAPSMRGPGEPEEDPFIEIGVCYIADENGPVRIDLEGMWFRKWAKTTFVSVQDDMEEKAWETYCDR